MKKIKRPDIETHRSYIAENHTAEQLQTAKYCGCFSCYEVAPLLAYICQLEKKYLPKSTEKK